MEAFFKTLSHSLHNNTKTQGAKLGGPTKLQAVQVDYFVLNKANTLCGPFVASDVYFQFHKSLGKAKLHRGRWTLVRLVIFTCFFNMYVVIIIAF